MDYHTDWTNLECPESLELLIKLDPGKGKGVFTVHETQARYPAHIISFHIHNNYN